MSTIDQNGSSADFVVGYGLLPLTLLAVGCGSACLVPWYADADGDGFGDPNELVEACQAPKQYVADASDCDDRDPAVHPEHADSCNGIDDDCNGVVDPEAREWFADIDGDGIGGHYSTWACSAPDGHVGDPGDCDDGNPKVYPTAVEVCDGLDQDCDMLVDEGAAGDVEWFPDDDGDGWGADGGGRFLCAPPDGWVDRDGDCDDGVDGQYRHPDLTEVCNGYDDDCDQWIDADDPQGADGSGWVYFDGDGDGHGYGFGVIACGVPAGFAGSNDDCDDGDPGISPDADEVCGGGDEDCDELVDSDDPSVDPATEVDGFADSDGDGLGDPEEPASICVIGDGVVGNDLDCDDTDPRIGPDDWVDDLDGDGAGAGTVQAGEDCAPPIPGMVNAAGLVDCDDGDPAIHEQAPDPCGDGLDQDCSGRDPACTPGLTGILAIEDLGRTWTEGATSDDGLGVVSAGADFDGDGFVDLLVGAPAGDGGVGTVRILAGPPPEGGLPWEAQTEIVGWMPAGELGASVAAVDDLAGDGLPDVIIGAPAAEGSGEAYLFTGLDGWAGPWLTITGDPNDEVGAAVANIGDVDGIGGLEVLIGAPGRDSAAMLSVGSGSQYFSSSSLVLAGPAGAGVGRFGQALACCTEIAAAGNPNLVIADPEESAAGGDAGVVWIVDPLQLGNLPVESVALARLHGQTGAHLGEALATGGDLDGDGRTDLVAAAPGDFSGGSGAGKIYGFTVNLAGDAEDVATWSVEGEFVGMGLAQSLAMGDVDGDGADDVAMGAELVDVGGGDGGAVYLFFGPVTGDDVASDADGVLYGPAGAHAGASIAIGPIDVDGGDDLWIGMPGLSPGVAWLVPGP